MSLRDLLTKYVNEKTRVLVNGMGDGTTKGTILELHKDYIDYELLEVKVEKKTGKQKQTREVKHIPIAQIVDISEGEVENTQSGGLDKF